jgi:2-methylisocitrate lyase-like PEP mutase family enzyme
MPSLAKRFRALIGGPDILVTPGVYDGFSTRLVDSLGFKAAAITGAGLSEARLGWADVGIMGFEQNLRSSEALAACCGIPLTADADTGYGNAINVHFTIKGFERAGIAGVMIEDQVWPKRCGHLAGKEVISAEEGVEKIRSAVAARLDPDFLVIARTDATAILGLDEAIRRLNLYAEAGADLLFADALMSRDDIATVARNVIKPLKVNMGLGIRARPTTPLLSARELQDLGVKVVSYPRLLTAAALQGMRNAIAVLMQSLAEGRVIERPDLLVSFQEINALMGLDTVKAMEQRFLSSDQLKTKYDNKAAAE